MNLQKVKSDTNFLIITLDSCRWDTFQQASTHNLNTLCKFNKAYSQGTYTLPSHLSIFAGILPNVNERIPYYNRFTKNLFRISARSINNSSFVEFPSDTKNIIAGFSEKGYRTIGTGAMLWFKNKILTESFDEFHYSGIDIHSQYQFIKKQINTSQKPLFMFINIGETHEPYEINKDTIETHKCRDLMRSNKNYGFLENEYEKQVNAIEYIDNTIYSFLEYLKNKLNNVVVVICSDHGECFGEDGFYGHGFYHNKVMEVPLGIFQL